MARPRKFDREQAISAATRVFWRKGYQGTTVQDLVEATGVNRGSLYGTFGDKAGLFDEVLTRYMAGSPTQRLTELAESGPPREVIERLFDDLVEAASRDGDRRGCLVTNTAVELTGRDKRIAGRIITIFAGLEDAFTRLIERGRETGEIAPWREPRALARLMIACVQGMRVLSKVTADPRLLREVADGALANLD